MNISPYFWSVESGKMDLKYPGGERMRSYNLGELLRKLFFFLLTFSVYSNAAVSINQYQSKEKWPLLRGDYLGQKVPGTVAEVFAPGLVSTELLEHSPPIFSKDGNELFWSYYDKGEHVIMLCSRVNKIWQKPVKFVHSRDGYDGNPFFSADWSKLVFHSARGGKRLDGKPDIQFWYLKRKNDGWTGAKRLNILPSKGQWAMYGSQSNKGHLYFTSKAIIDSKEFQLHMARFNGKTWETAKPLSEKFNSSAINWTPFVDPDERYLIFSSDRKKSGSDFHACDLYISVKNDRGEWEEPKCLGPEINSEQIERFPWVSPDGKYLFFVRGFGDIFWVSTGVLNCFLLH